MMFQRWEAQCDRASVQNRRPLSSRQLPTDLSPQLHRCQGGFRWGADMMAGYLIDVLHMQSATHTFVAFVDIFKAFDTSWVEATMVELFSMEVQGRMWALTAHFVHGVRALAGLRYSSGQSALSVALQHSC